MQPRIDDSSIGDEERLWRRIIPQWIVQAEDGKLRPSSAAFLDGHTGEVSVHIAALTDEDKALEDRPNDSLVEIKAGLPRSLGHAIVRDPTEKDPSHALICPPPGRTGKPRKSDARKMAQSAEWIVLKPPSE
jgi:hypothetical protein